MVAGAGALYCLMDGRIVRATLVFPMMILEAHRRLMQVCNL